MPQTIQIKRSSGTAVPASLLDGELGYSTNSDKLFVGVPGPGVDTIGGKVYVDKLDNIEAGAEVTSTAKVDSAGAVMETDYDANSVLMATADNTPLVVTLAVSQLLGRKSSGGPTNLTKAEALAILNVEDGAEVTSTAKVAAANALMKSGGTMTDKITLDGDPTAALHAVTKQYVDAMSAGLDPKSACDVATTANITLSGEQTLDGILTSASRVLVKNQTDKSENGIYTSAAGAWSRTSDTDENAEVTSGLYTIVIGGTVHAQQGWVITTTGAITVGTTDVDFGIFSDASGAPVASVNTKTGAVVIDPDDLDDSGTTNKFTSATEITKLSNIAANATIDQTDPAIETAYNNQVGAASQSQMETGTEAAIKRMSPLRVRQAILASPLDGGTF